MLALLQNEMVIGGVIVTVVLFLAIWRFIGLKKTANWIVGRNTPEQRRSRDRDARDPNA